MEGMRITKEEADRLLKKYYNGLTNNEEERQLRIFLASPMADGGFYDADRAVMGFFSMSHKSKNKKSTRGFKKASIAAAACIFLTVGFWGYYSVEKSESVAYINGVKCTNQEVVMEQMAQTMQAVGQNTGSDVVKNQMQAVFNMNEND